MKEFDQLLQVIKRLRSPGGCPWDRAQNIDNMKNYLLEEVYELIDAINSKKASLVQEELGDVFLILMVISEMYQEKKRFSLSDVLNNIKNKLIVRHPHVFSDSKLRTKEEVLNHWIKNKAKKKKRKTIKERLPLNMPALLLAKTFFKEASYLNKNTKPIVKTKIMLSEMKDKLVRLEKTKDQKRVMTGIISDICKLAFMFDIDLESSLRKVILNLAEKEFYHKQKE